MKKKNNIISIEELTNREIQRLEDEDKFSKYEKEIAKYKKQISNLKEKDKLYSKAFAICESKINKLRENSLDSLLFLCESIKDIKHTFYNQCEKIESFELKSQFILLAEEYDFILNSIYEVCDKIEDDAHFTKDDREIIPNKFELSDLSKIYNYEEFAEIRKTLKKHIAKKYNKNIDDNEGNDTTIEKVEENSDYQNNDVIAEKFNKIFYDKPSSVGATSGIKPSDDSIFDFNEALNPTLSLSDIMNDLMSLDSFDEDDELNDDEIVIKDDSFEFNEFDSDEEELESEYEKIRKERQEKIESKMSSQTSKITRRDINTNEFEHYEEPQHTKEDYEKKFTYLQNIFRDLK